MLLLRKVHNGLAVRRDLCLCSMTFRLVLQKTNGVLLSCKCAQIKADAKKGFTHMPALNLTTSEMLPSFVVFDGTKIAGTLEHGYLRSGPLPEVPLLGQSTVVR